jgi:hypothetical protein
MRNMKVGYYVFAYYPSQDNARRAEGRLTEQAEIFRETVLTRMSDEKHNRDPLYFRNQEYSEILERKTSYRRH